MGKPYVVRRIGGKDYKLCKGPMHSEDGEWILVSEFSYRTDGRLRGNCRRCEHFWRYGKIISHSKYLPLKDFRFAIKELEGRLGRMESARRVGVSRTTWNRWLKHGRYIQAAKAVLLITTLSEVRKKNEVRHRKSIKYGSAMRGRKEKVPTTRRDFYKPNWD